MPVKFKHFNNEQKSELVRIFSKIKNNPYENYYKFKEEIKEQIKTFPVFIINLCNEIKNEIKNGNHAHFIRNCPIDVNIPKLNIKNPSADKYNIKKIFISEIFLQSFAELIDAPIFQYDTSNLDIESSFFYEVYGLVNHKKNNFIKDILWHSDENHRKIVPDYITLLGLRSCEDNLTFTSLIENKELLKNIPFGIQENLRKKYFYDISSEKITKFSMILDRHPILENDYCIRYCSTQTQCLLDTPTDSRDALIAFHDAIAKTYKERLQISKGDLLFFSNKYYIHNRETIQINNMEEAYHRWLMKTFNFKNSSIAKSYKNLFVNNRPFVL